MIEKRGEKFSKNLRKTEPKKSAKNDAKKGCRKPLIPVTFRFSVFRPKSAFRKSLSSFAGLGALFRLAGKSMYPPLCKVSKREKIGAEKIDF